MNPGDITRGIVDYMYQQAVLFGLGFGLLLAFSFGCGWWFGSSR